MTDPDHVIAKIADFFNNKLAKISLTRIYKSLEGSKLEYIQTGIKNYLMNPDDEQWQDFIQDLLDKHSIYIDEAPKLIQWFNTIGISVIQKESYRDRSYIDRWCCKLEVEFSQPVFSVGKVIESAKRIIPLSFPSDLDIQLKTILTCLTQIYIMENTFRLIIIELEKKGAQIEFTSKIKDNILRRRVKEKDWVPLRGDHDLFWTTLGELIKIYNSHINQEQFKSVGLSQSRIEDIINMLKSIEPFRNLSAHFPLYFPRKDYATILNGEWTKFKLLLEGLTVDSII
ncbi:MAG: hypothetical protein ACFE9L_04810 [Candidatus Hodarchaeota archaeon]